MHLVAAGFLERGALFRQVFFRNRVHLVQRHDLGLFGQAFAVSFQFGPDSLVGLPHRIAGAVNQRQDGGAAFGMTQKAVAQTDTFMRAFDKTGKIGQHEIGLVHFHHAQLRFQGGEGIVGDLGPRRRHARQESGLAGIGHADQAGIGDQLQLEDEDAFFRRLPRQREVRRLVGRALEMIVAEAAIAALQQAEALAHRGHVHDQRLAVFFIDLGADRNLHDGVVAALAGHHLAQAALPALGFHMLLEAVVDQGVEIVHGLGDHVAPAAAIAAIGAAIFDELLAAERNAAVPAGAGLGIDLGDIQKAHQFVPLVTWPAFTGQVPSQAACFRRKSVRVNSMSWQRIAIPRARDSRMAEPLWRAPSLARTWPEAGLS